MKKFIYTILAAGLTTGLASCNDWLKEESPGNIRFDDFYTEGTVCIQNVNACYTPLAWEYNKTYFPEWYIGDVASDDAIKGGQNLADGGDLYDIDNFKINANNAILLDYYRAKYQGIQRCNLALQEVAARFLLFPARARVRRSTSGRPCDRFEHTVAPAPRYRRRCLRTYYR